MLTSFVPSDSESSSSDVSADPLSGSVVMAQRLLDVHDSSEPKGIPGVFFDRTKFEENYATRSSGPDHDLETSDFSGRPAGSQLLAEFSDSGTPGLKCLLPEEQHSVKRYAIMSFKS